MKPDSLSRWFVSVDRKTPRLLIQMCFNKMCSPPSFFQLKKKTLDSQTGLVSHLILLVQVVDIVQRLTSRLQRLVPCCFSDRLSDMSF